MGTRTVGNLVDSLGGGNGNLRAKNMQEKKGGTFGKRYKGGKHEGKRKAWGKKQNKKKKDPRPKVFSRTCRGIQ